LELPTYFDRFLQDIRLTPSQVEDAKIGHKTLRERLRADADLAGIVVSDFLQGSYRRATAVRPKSNRRSDVDVIVVTALDRHRCTPADVLARFTPFLDRHYKGKWEPQGRSFGIELSYVDLDLVPTSAPSEVEQSLLKSASVRTEHTLAETADWRLVPSWPDLNERISLAGKAALSAAENTAQWNGEPLWIPDRDAGNWEETDPLTQIRWTADKNRACSGHYVNVVKALKWWRRVHYPHDRPKGYPLEHLIGQTCPGGISSVAMGVTLALESMRERYAACAQARQVPILPDHGVPSHNVLARMDADTFAAFHAQVQEAAALARRAYDARDTDTSVAAWRVLFGGHFPNSPDQDRGGNPPGGYSPRQGPPTAIRGDRFA